jgi:hypothetical protein
MAFVTGAAIDAGVTGEVTQLPLVALYALAVCGGIRKMSPLVQWGEVQVLDLQRNELLLRRTVTFRGDTDTARGRFCQRNVEGCHALNSRVVNGGHVHP